MPGDRREYFRSRMARLRVQWREDGLCTRCGWSRENPDKVTCAACRMKMTDYYRTCVTALRVEMVVAHTST